MTHFIEPTLALAKFIKDYPEATAWIIGGLITMLGSLLGGYHLVLAKRMEKFEQKLEQHMNEDTSLFHSGLDALHSKLTEIQMENADAHARIISEHGQRIARVESGLENVARRMPNGELKSILSKLDDLAQALMSKG